MDFQNFKLKNFSLKDEKLQLIEQKQASIIGTMKRECEKLSQMKNHASSPAQKLWWKKQIQNKYTFQLPESAKSLSRILKESTLKETFKNGWKNKTESKSSPQCKEIAQRRTKMILAGNSFSLNNLRRSETPQLNKKVCQTSSMAEIKQKMIIKSRQLGNHYTQVFMQSQKSPSRFITVDELDRYHRLISKKQEIEKNHRKLMRTGAEFPVSNSMKYSKLSEEIRRLEKILRVKNRSCGADCRGELQWKADLNVE